jgi:hypothetical protein
MLPSREGRGFPCSLPGDGRARHGRLR